MQHFYLQMQSSLLLASHASGHAHTSVLRSGSLKNLISCLFVSFYHLSCNSLTVGNRVSAEAFILGSVIQVSFTSTDKTHEFPQRRIQPVPLSEVWNTAYAGTLLPERGAKRRRYHASDCCLMIPASSMGHECTSVWARRGEKEDELLGNMDVRCHLKLSNNKH